MSERVSVWATVDIPGLHRWPSAPDHRAYLRSPHRHLFRVRAEVRVCHSDRDVEFHDLQDLIRQAWSSLGNDLGSNSCEDLAHIVGWHLIKAGLVPVQIDVSEDQENGATLRYEESE